MPAALRSFRRALTLLAQRNAHTEAIATTSKRSKSYEPCRCRPLRYCRHARPPKRNCKSYCSSRAMPRVPAKVAHYASRHGSRLRSALVSKNWKSQIRSSGSRLERHPMHKRFTRHGFEPRKNAPPHRSSWDLTTKALELATALSWRSSFLPGMFRQKRSKCFRPLSRSTRRSMTRSTPRQAKPRHLPLP